MKTIQVICLIGEEVILADDVPAKVIGIVVNGENYCIEYKCSWFIQGQHFTEWLSALEIRTDSKQKTIGFEVIK